MRRNLDGSKINYLTESEIERFFGAISGYTGKRDTAMFTLCYWRGLRASELRLITRDAIDMIGKTIHIKRLKGSFGGQYQLTDQEHKALAAWMADPKCQGATLFDVQRAQVFNLFRKYAEIAGLPADRRHPHVLKHSIATHLLDRGLGILDVQDWLGHRDLQNTTVYGKVTSAQRRAAAKKVMERNRNDI